jgi:hypothetical protein
MRSGRRQLVISQHLHEGTEKTETCQSSNKTAVSGQKIELRTDQIRSRHTKHSKITFDYHPSAATIIISLTSKSALCHPTSLYGIVKELMNDSYFYGTWQFTAALAQHSCEFLA